MSETRRNLKVSMTVRITNSVLSLNGDVRSLKGVRLLVFADETDEVTDIHVPVTQVLPSAPAVGAYSGALAVMDKHGKMHRFTFDSPQVHLFEDQVAFKLIQEDA